MSLAWYGFISISLFGITFSFSVFFFLLRKICPELTSMSIFLYFVCGLALQHGLVSRVSPAWGSEPRMPTAEVEPVNLTTGPQGWPQVLLFNCNKSLLLK